MNCPVCTVPLVIADRQGVEIDYCPQCRGVWLDRGELDKIVDRMAALSAPPAQSIPPAAPAPQAPPPGPVQPTYVDPAYGQPGYGNPYPVNHPKYAYYARKRKRKGLLGELFDF